MIISGYPRAEQEEEEEADRQAGEMTRERVFGVSQWTREIFCRGALASVFKTQKQINENVTI